MKIRGMGLAMVVLWMAVAGARAEQGWGVGMILGEPTGVTVKKWLGPERALDAAAAWSFSENDSFQFHADYLIHKYIAWKTEEAAGRLPVYFGVGARVKMQERHGGRGRNDHDTLLGVRVPFGLAYLFPKAPVELFAELVPILDVFPDTDLDVNAAIGARYTFR